MPCSGWHCFSTPSQAWPESQPCLDSLYDASLAFSRLFANGNRTVRGLEALTLCRPPAPGESIIKRPDNSGYPSEADRLETHGYRKIFFYGGDSYFDNMESFFSGLGYDIFTVLSPGSKLRQYAVTPTADNPLAITEVTPAPAGPAARAAITYYQSSTQK